MGILSRAARNLARRKIRAIIVIAALTLALTLLITLPPSINERADLTRKAIDTFVEWNDIAVADVTLSATEIQCEYGVNLDPNLMFNVGEGEAVWLSKLTMNESIHQSLVSFPDVNTVVPIFEELTTANHSYQIYSVPLSNSSCLKDPTILPSNITMGRNLQVGDSGVIVVDEIIAKNYSWIQGTREEQMAALHAKDYVVHVGDSFEVLGRNFTVVGIEGYDPYDPVIGSHGVTMSLDDAWSVTGRTGQATKYLIFVDDVDSVGPVVARIQNLDPKLLVSAGYLQLNSISELQSQIAELTNSAQSTLTSIQSIGMAEIALAVVAVVVVMLFMMLYSVRERTKEIGTLKAMGANNPTILGQFMFEGILLCLIAAVIAIAVSVFVLPTVSSALLPAPVGDKLPYLTHYPNGTRYLGTDGFSRVETTPASVTPELMLFAVGLALLLGALGSLYPALKAARTKPAEAMRYE
jgi:putative ABC transport system permease protein